jgi:heterodisulfide reductase subunit B
MTLMNLPPIATRRYVKPIPDDGYYLTQSCVFGALNPAHEKLVARLFDLLGRRWTTGGPGVGCQNTCCTGMSMHGSVMTPESQLLVVARLWALCAEAGFENIAASCVTSFATHNECAELLHTEPGLAAKVDAVLFKSCGRQLVVPDHIVHCSDIIYRYRSELSRFMSHRLVDVGTGRPLKVVDHVGCHYNKLMPRKSVGGSEYCDVLTAMIREWGGAEVDYPERRHCCGMGFRQCVIRPNRGFTVACVRKKLESMAPFAPDLMVTNCPGCLHILDREQWAVSQLTGVVYDIPVLTYAELAALLLGWDPYELVGIQMHTVPVEPVLERIGIPASGASPYLHERPLARQGGGAR